MAAPKNNQNALKTGKFSRGLIVGRLPAGMTGVKKRLSALKRHIEAALLESKGSVDLSDDLAIQTALRYELAAAVAQRTLATRTDLSSDQHVAYSAAIAKASSERDKAIRTLNLSRDDALAPPWAKPNALEAVGSEATGQLDQREAANDPNAATATVDAQASCASC